jgi:hypothetical protein
MRPSAPRERLYAANGYDIKVNLIRPGECQGAEIFDKVFTFRSGKTKASPDSFLTPDQHQPSRQGFNRSQLAPDLRSGAESSLVRLPHPSCA